LVLVGAGPCACPVFGQPPIEKLGSLPLNVFHGFGARHVEHGAKGTEHRARSMEHRARSTMRHALCSMLLHKTHAYGAWGKGHGA
jgi:hypothetical protein